MLIKMKKMHRDGYKTTAKLLRKCKILRMCLKEARSSCSYMPKQAKLREKTCPVPKQMLQMSLKTA